MGYSHHFENVKMNDKVFEEAQVLIENSPAQLAGWDGTGDPQVNRDQIKFNGFDGGPGNDGSFETFLLEDNDSFSFCKTNEKPYDATVTAVLISVILNDAGTVSSDGTFEEWSRGIKHYENHFGKLNNANRNKIKKALA